MSGESLPLVSVIIPTIKVDETFRESLASVLVQDYPRLEVIVILDGAPEITRPIWASDPRIKWVVSPERKGTPRALNLGIAESGGEFLARLDADDLALPGRFSAQVAYLVENPTIDCVGTGVQVIDETGRVLNSRLSPAEPTQVASELLTHNCIVHSSVMYRSSIIARLGGYSPKMTRMQDYELFLRMACIGNIASIRSELVAYRVHPGQHSRKSYPWAEFTRIVLRRRLQLALTLDVSIGKQVWRNILWFGAQVLRHYQVRRPGYLRKEIGK